MRRAAAVLLLIGAVALWSACAFAQIGGPVVGGGAAGTAKITGGTISGITSLGVGTVPATNIRVEIAGGPRFRVLDDGSGAVFASTGKGVEIGATGGIGFIIGYDRGLSAYLPVQVNGNPLSLNANGLDVAINGKLLISTGSTANQVRTAQSTAPTCSTNCGTSPSIAGTDTAGVVTMGATGVPASGWVVTFNGTWASAPACTVQMAKAGMVVGKQPLTVVTTTTTITVVTNGTAPAVADQYAYICIGVS